MDLYPEALVAVGWVRPGSRVHRLLCRINLTMLRGADHVVALGPYQKVLINACGAASPVRIIAPWDDRDLRTIPKAENRFLKAHNLYGKRILLYAGNCGRGHSFEEILELSRRWKDRKDICFVFAGGGVAFPKLEAFRRKESLANLLVLAYQPEEWTSDLLSCADLHLVSMKSGFQGIMVPSKLFAILKVGGAVGFIGPSDCDTSWAIREGNFGFSVECGQVERLAKNLERCLSQPALLASYQNAARAYHVRSAAASFAYVQWSELLTEVSVKQRQSLPGDSR